MRETYRQDGKGREKLSSGFCSPNFILMTDTDHIDESNLVHTNSFKEHFLLTMYLMG